MGTGGNATMVAAAGDLRASIRRLAALYRIDGPSFDAVLDRLFLDAYAEVVLLRDGLEITIGGVGMRQRLADLAASLGVGAETIRLFGTFARRLPDRIGYLKLCFGPHASAPTMHCGAVIPWRDIVRFVADEPALAAAVPAVAALRDADSLCHLVAFQAAPVGRPNAGEPMMKIYWLLDQSADGSPSPMLAAARVAGGRVRPEGKRYWMGVGWARAAIDARWRTLVDAARREFPDDAVLSLSHLLRGDAVLEQKLYIFAQDARIARRDTPTAWNLYYQEGLHHLHQRDYPRARAAFRNAIAFQPGHAHAINNHGYCRLMEGDPQGALRDFEHALDLDPTLSPANRDHARALLDPAIRGRA